MQRNSIPCNEVKNKVTTQRACRVPETHGSLHTKFVLKGSQRRGSVVGPIAPSASSQAILHEQDVLCTCMRETTHMFIMFTLCYYFISWCGETCSSDQHICIHESVCNLQNCDGLHKCRSKVTLSPCTIPKLASLPSLLQLKRVWLAGMSWKNMPMMAIIARRPFANSALNFLVFSAGSDDVKTLNPKSPAAAGVPGDWSWETSQKAMYAKICPHPAAGTLEMAARPLGTSANFKPAEGER